MKKNSRINVATLKKELRSHTLEHLPWNYTAVYGHEHAPETREGCAGADTSVHTGPRSENGEPAAESRENPPGPCGS